jgi:hypothetical protein
MVNQMRPLLAMTRSLRALLVLAEQVEKQLAKGRRLTFDGSANAFAEVADLPILLSALLNSLVFHSRPSDEKATSRGLPEASGTLFALRKSRV